jgi:hypothetical protein
LPLALRLIEEPSSRGIPVSVHDRFPGTVIGGVREAPNDSATAGVGKESEEDARRTIINIRKVLRMIILMGQCVGAMN